MKDISYYAGFLSTEDQQKINDASLYQLTDLLSDICCDIYSAAVDELAENEQDEPLEIGWETVNSRDKLALIRGLCDRIELKLKEAAQ